MMRMGEQPPENIFSCGTVTETLEPTEIHETGRE